MTRILKLSHLTPQQLNQLKRRSEQNIDQALAIAKEVIEQVKMEGDAGVLHYSRQFDFAGATAENLRVSEAICRSGKVGGS